MKCWIWVDKKSYIRARNGKKRTHENSESRSLLLSSARASFNRELTQRGEGRLFTKKGDAGVPETRETKGRGNRENPT